MLTMRFCAGGLSNLYRDWLSGALSFSLDELTRRAEDLLCGFMAGGRRFCAVKAMKFLPCYRPQNKKLFSVGAAFAWDTSHTS